MPKKTLGASARLTLMDRFRKNKEATLARLEELDEEDKSGLAHLDPIYQRLRREYEELEREFDRQNLKRLGESQVAIYGAGGKTVTSVAALSGANRHRRAKAKPKKKRRIRF